MGGPGSGQGSGGRRVPPPGSECPCPRTDGGTCRNWRDDAHPKGYCKAHAKRYPSTTLGVKNPAFKTGLFSQMPKGWFERFEALLNDPDLLSVRKHKALIDTMIDRKTEQLETGESGSAWKRANSIFTKLQQTILTKRYLDALFAVLEELAKDDRDWNVKIIKDNLQIIPRNWPEVIPEALKDLHTVLDNGVGLAPLEAEIDALTASSRKLMLAEHKRLLENKLVISVERQMAIMTATVSLIAMKAEKFFGSDASPFLEDLGRDLEKMMGPQNAQQPQLTTGTEREIA